MMRRFHLGETTAVRTIRCVAPLSRPGRNHGLRTKSRRKQPARLRRPAQPENPIFSRRKHTGSMPINRRAFGTDQITDIEIPMAGGLACRQTADTRFASAAVSIATEWSEPVPGAEVAPAEFQRLSRRTFSPIDLPSSLIPILHEGGRCILRLYAHGKLRSRRETTNIVFSRITNDERLFVDASVEFAINAICVINLSYIAPVPSFGTRGTRYGRFRDGPGTGPEPFEHAGRHSIKVLDVDVDD
jgi:hypothetical protein